MSKIGLVSDTTSPSLPLMKISAFHKLNGDSVKFADDIAEKFDILYVSKIFNLNLKKIKNVDVLPPANKIIRGGSGYAISVVDGQEIYQKNKDPDLPAEIENIYPDYSLYGLENSAHGFLTRGCPNSCPYCIVSKKDGLCSRKVADLKDFWRGQSEIKIYDANILACEERERLIQQLIDSNANIDFPQGLDARLLNDDIARLISRLKMPMAHFAFDLMKNEKQILNGLKLFAKHFKKGERNKRVYILTNYNTTLQEDLYRVRKVKELGYTPYVMIYRKGTHSRFLTDLQRWSNNMFLHQATTFENYIPRKDGYSVKRLYGDILKSA